MYEELYAQAMLRRDLNKDGYLNLHEFLMDDQGTFPDSKSENFMVEKDKFENDYDQDKDGKLNKREVLLWIIPDNRLVLAHFDYFNSSLMESNSIFSREMAESEANHLIESSDDNSDGKLSVDEIVNHHDIFVGSEATDFGDRLNKIHDEL